MLISVVDAEDFNRLSVKPVDRNEGERMEDDLKQKFTLGTVSGLNLFTRTALG